MAQNGEPSSVCQSFNNTHTTISETHLFEDFYLYVDFYANNFSSLAIRKASFSSDVKGEKFITRGNFVLFGAIHGRILQM